MKNLLVTVLMMSSLAAFAGDKGNGGYSVVCRDNTNTITSAELLDIFEGRVLRYYEYSNNSTLNEEHYLQYALERISKVDARVSKRIANTIKKNEAVTIFINDQLVLEATNDAFPIINRRDCKFEQLATYLDEGKLLISDEIYSKLSPLDKAALKLHEAIYLEVRKAGELTSTNSRLLTAWALAVEVGRDNKVNEIINKINSTIEPEEEKECGLTGTLEERVFDCNETIMTSSGHKWKVIQKKKKVTYKKGIKTVYLSPTNRIIYDGTLTSLPIRKTESKKIAKRLMRAKEESRLCSEIQYAPSTLVKELSLDFKLATDAEIEEFFTKYEANEVLRIGNSQYVSGDSTYSGTCDFSKFFVEYAVYYFDSFQVKKYKNSPCELSSFNPRINKQVQQKVVSSDLISICVD